jgi:hypothetical protein
LTLVKEFRREKTEGKNRGLKLRLLDVTAAMVVGPDGHPNHYGHWSPENVTLADRVHWCLPGPTDTWKELLLQMLKRERWRGAVWLQKKNMHVDASESVFTLANGWEEFMCGV